MANHREIDSESLLDRAVAQIADSQPTAESTAAAGARVWSQLNCPTAAVAAGAAEVEHISGCEDYQALIPAYLAGALPTARKVLVEDHTRSCVPCRRALKNAREGKPIAAMTPSNDADVATARRQGRNPLFSRLALAATLIIGLGMAQILIREFLPSGSSAQATVETVEGTLFRVSEASHMPIQTGDVVREGEILRTGRDGGAVLRLEDGSLVEMRQRSEISVDKTRRGTVVELERGSVIVQAADQRQRHLYVSTEDCLVSVTGTVFSVDHGTKGSRVSVIEGEVRVSHSGDEHVLLPGDQVTTRANLGLSSLVEQYTWGRDLDTYLGLMEEIADLKREIRDTVPRAGQRHSSRLLDLMPEGTVFYAALPNLGTTVRETHRLVEERITRSPAFSEWWTQNGSEDFQNTVANVVAGFGEFSDFLGDELAVGGGFEADELHGPLVTAEVTDPEGLREFIEQKIDDLEISDANIIFLDEPTGSTEDNSFYLWLHDGLMVGSPKVEQITQVATVLGGAPNPFTASDFYASIAALYAEGVGIIIAADLEGVVDDVLHDQEQSEKTMRGMRAMGVHNARHLLAEQKTVDDLTQHRVAVTFSEAREGFASWLAAPAPMGVLDFISSDAKLVAAFVVRDPVKLFDELRSLGDGEDGFSEVLQLFRERRGIDLRDDFIATLGGEFAFAIDGPLFPTPAWKLVFEVYDPASFQWSIEQGLVEANAHLVEEGKEPLEIQHQEVGGRTFYTLPTKAFEVHYTFVEGYLLAAPNRTLLDRAIRFRDAGFSITDQPRFNSLMPDDGRNNFSALVYQDFSGVLQSVAEKLADGQGLSDEQQAALNGMKVDSSPTLGYAYAEDTRITFAATHQGDVLSSVLMQMFGVNNPASLGNLLKGAMEGL
jgi:hypothetical protein